MSVEISKEASEKAIGSIRRYFSERLEQEIGELQARLLLEFMLKEIGPTVYNAAVADAQVYMRDRVADLEGACYETEFAYWPKETRRAGR
jgi:uncharacterized protein (DUF2164 family)